MNCFECSGTYHPVNFPYVTYNHKTGDRRAALNMKTINSLHRYEYDAEKGYVPDCFGDEMDGVDDHVDEMNMLMANVRQLEYELAKFKEPIPDIDIEQGDVVVYIGGGAQEYLVVRMGDEKLFGHVQKPHLPA